MTALPSLFGSPDHKPNPTMQEMISYMISYIRNRAPNLEEISKTKGNSFYGIPIDKDDKRTARRLRNTYGHEHILIEGDRARFISQNGKMRVRTLKHMRADYNEACQLMNKTKDVMWIVSNDKAYKVRYYSGPIRYGMPPGTFTIRTDVPPTDPLLPEPQERPMDFVARLLREHGENEMIIEYGVQQLPDGKWDRRFMLPAAQNTSFYLESPTYDTDIEAEQAAATWLQEDLVEYLKTKGLTQVRSARRDSEEIEGDE